MLRRTLVAECRALSSTGGAIRSPVSSHSIRPLISSPRITPLYTSIIRNFAATGGSVSAQQSGGSAESGGGMSPTSGGGGLQSGPQVFGQSGKYATALFNTAKKRGGDTMHNIINELQTFYRAYQSNVQLSQALDNPVLSPQKKADIVKKVAPQLKISSLATEFLSVLASKGHISLLKDIIQDYERLVSHERNEARAVVTTAEPLTDDQRKRITDALKKRVSGNKQLNLSEKVEPKILGGLIVSVDDKAVDLSVATQIRKIDSALRRQ